VLRFTAATNFLDIAGSKTSLKFLHSEDSTAFLVSRVGTNSDPQAVMAIIGTEIGTAYVCWGINYLDTTANNQLGITVGRGVSGQPAAVLSETGAWTPNLYSVLRVTTRPTDATAANRIKYKFSYSGEGGTNVFSNARSTADATYDFRVGARSLNGAFPLIGDVAEVLLYNRILTAGELDAVESFLKTKWGTL
jgi:hypothetical protein